jgi:hypothetical protein
MFSVSWESVLRLAKQGGQVGRGEKTLEGNFVSLVVQSTVVVNVTSLYNVTICFGRIFRMSK